MKCIVHIAVLAGVLVISACAADETVVTSTVDDNSTGAAAQNAEAGEVQAKGGVADLQEMERLADLGDAGAQYELALAYEIGAGVARDAVEARRWFLRAAAGGNREAQYKAGLYYEGGHTVPKDVTEALNWYRSAQGQGHQLAGRRVLELERALSAAAMAAIVEARAEEIMPAVAAYESRDYTTAYQEFNRFAQRSNAGAQYHLGLMHDIGSGVPADPDLARQWYVAAAWNGYADAQYKVGAMNQFGYLVTKNAEGALVWYRQAAEQGHRLAQRRVDELERTLGVKSLQDASSTPQIEAADTTEMAESDSSAGVDNAVNLANVADSVDVVSAAGTATITDSSEPAIVVANADAAGANAIPTAAETTAVVPAEVADPPERSVPGQRANTNATLVADVQAALAAYSGGEKASALENTRRLAEQGDPQAQYDLGVIYAKGDETTKDIDRAARWYRRAADQGVARAQYDLGVLYSEGRGVAKNDEKATNLYREAAKQGLVEAQAKLDQMVTLAASQESVDQSPGSPAESNTAQLTPPTSQLAGPLQEYRIGAGDRINMIVFGHEDLSGEFLVDGSGRVSLPLLGQVDAYNKTIAEFQTDITTALDRDFIVNPRVSVEVINYRPFFILGQVNNPGSYSYIEGMTARMAVALAGGFTRRARESTVVVVRANDPAQTRLSVGLETPVLPGDTIEVERRLF